MEVEVEGAATTTQWGGTTKALGRCGSEVRFYRGRGRREQRRKRSGGDAAAR